MLEIKKLWRIVLDILKVLYLVKKYNFPARFKVRLCRIFDKNEANANSKAWIVLMILQPLSSGKDIDIELGEVQRKVQKCY